MGTIVQMTKQQYKEQNKKYWNEVEKASETMEGKELEQYSNKLFKKVVGCVEIVLEKPPVHRNQGIVDLINEYCDDMKEKNEECTIYNGRALIVFGAETNNYYLPNLSMDKLRALGFTYKSEWSNGHRRIYINQEEQVFLIECEGDLMISLHTSIEDFKREYKECERFYNEN